MNGSCVQLNDLPDELLMFIFKQMNNVEVLYSLFGVNERLNSILQDPIFTNRLNFLKWSSKKFLNIFSPDIIFDRFCLQILPAIHEKIQWLDIESSSMKQILCAANYSNLYGLGLFNIEEETIKNLFTDVNLSSDLFKNQITRLLITVDTNQNLKHYLTMKYICNHIFDVFKKLTHLIFSQSSYQNMVGLPFIYPPINFCSSTLLVLNVKINHFETCLCFLDGRFNKLHTLIVESADICSLGEIENKGDVPSLMCFSLSCVGPIDYYDKLILPLLYRMSNLEKLNLSLSISVEETLIDGYHLKNKILNHMSRLNQFTFDIHSMMNINNEIILPSKEDIQNTFKDFQYTQIISYMNHFLERKECQCHIYTYPSQISYYQYISNQFPGGYYPYVRIVSLYDEYPFEHEFFLQLVQSFPFIEKLVLINRKSQQHQQSYKSMNNSCHLSIVEYSRLIELDIEYACDDYIEEFLCDTKTCFRKNISLRILDHSLLRVTENFTREDTRMNCTKAGPHPPFNSDPQDSPGLESQMDPKPDYGYLSYNGSGKLQGKIAIITGDDSGIGRAVVLAFAREGATPPMTRPAQPRELAPAFVFLASSRTFSYVLGEILAVTGDLITA
ncbi:unnamed protein product [Rotaria sordida]|uniref:F-box domain-containing protein n=1 Tax=Rotaria sordida TaxID=392033 RepID=A0A815FPB2_9BILA|nr:unnamed protein product [Rotaria sordida]